MSQIEIPIAFMQTRHILLIFFLYLTRRSMVMGEVQLNSHWFRKIGLEIISILRSTVPGTLHY